MTLDITAIRQRAQSATCKRCHHGDDGGETCYECNGTDRPQWAHDVLALLGELELHRPWPTKPAADPRAPQDLPLHALIEDIRGRLHLTCPCCDPKTRGQFWSCDFGNFPTVCYDGRACTPRCGFTACTECNGTGVPRLTRSIADLITETEAMQAWIDRLTSQIAQMTQEWRDEHTRCLGYERETESLRAIVDTMDHEKGCCDLISHELLSDYLAAHGWTGRTDYDHREVTVWTPTDREHPRFGSKLYVCADESTFAATRTLAALEGRHPVRTVLDILSMAPDSTRSP